MHLIFWHDFECLAILFYLELVYCKQNDTCLISASPSYDVVQLENKRMVLLIPGCEGTTEYR